MPRAPSKRGKRLQQRESNFQALYRAYRSRAKKSARAFELTVVRFREIVTSNCFVCGAKPAQRYKHDKTHGDPFIYNGIDRMDNDQGYVEGNVAPCCAHCNYAKGTHSLEQFLLYIYRAYNHSVLPALNEGAENDEATDL